MVLVGEPSEVTPDSDPPSAPGPTFTIDWTAAADANERKTLLLITQNVGNGGYIRLVFASGDVGFNLVSRGGQDYISPISCTVGTDVGFFVQENQTMGFEVEFDMVYTDGAAKSLEIEFYDSLGNLIRTATFQGTVLDPVVSAANNNLTDIIGIWAPQPIAATRSDGDTLFSDALGAEPNIIYRRSTGTAWSIDSTLPPGTIGIMSHSVLAPTSTSTTTQ